MRFEQKMRIFYCNDITVKYVFVLNASYTVVGSRPMCCFPKFFRGIVSINEENLEKIRRAKRPTTKKEVWSFLDLANYYRDHIPSFAAIAAPLSDLTKRDCRKV